MISPPKSFSEILTEVSQKKLWLRNYNRYNNFQSSFLIVMAQKFYISSISINDLFQSSFLIVHHNQIHLTKQPDLPQFQKISSRFKGIERNQTMLTRKDLNLIVYLLMIKMKSIFSIQRLDCFMITIRFTANSSFSDMKLRDSRKH